MSSIILNYIFGLSKMLNYFAEFFNKVIKPIFLKKPRFLFFVIVFSYIAHCLNLVATQLLNICLIAEAELHS